MGFTASARPALSTRSISAGLKVGGFRGTWSVEHPDSVRKKARRIKNRERRTGDNE
jgi:hypothetical protein